MGNPGVTVYKLLTVQIWENSWLALMKTQLIYLKMLT